ncbi:MAG: hypothetical protein MI702_10425 [Chlorobiales bacterium]|nr:hypothetical protein [Chlorobiales bacterium]
MAGRLLHRIEIKKLEGQLSTPDPMLNGLLYAVFVNLNLSKVHLSANFENRNRLLVEATVRPYLVLLEVARFLAALPYLRLIKATLAHGRS